MITVIGLDGSPLAPEAAAAIRAATLVVGGHRQLRAAARDGARTVALGELRPALDALTGHSGDAVVLASGDPGFFGIVRALHSHGLEYTVIPAVSSVALAFARAGLSWDDAVVVSAHGRDLRQAVNVCRAHPKVAVLTAPGAGPAEIGAALAGWQRRLIVCEHLGSERECVRECRPATARRQAWEDPNVVLVLARPSAPTRQPRASLHVIRESMGSGPQQSLDHHGGGAARGAGEASAGEIRDTAGPAGAGAGNGPGWIWPHQPAAGGWALAEDAFDTRDAVITKAEVRALALARLAPAPGTLVWDVGAGTGSVAVECARFGAAVVAVERDSRRCARVRLNARRHLVDVRVLKGTAPDALAWLPDPDSVFIGGGGTAVVEAVAERKPGRIVVALAAMERAVQMRAALAAAGYAVDGALLQSARFAPLPGDVHRLASTNPVFLLWALSPATAGPGGSRGGAR